MEPEWNVKSTQLLPFHDNGCHSRKSIAAFFLDKTFILVSAYIRVQAFLSGDMSGDELLALASYSLSWCCSSYGRSSVNLCDNMYMDSSGSKKGWCFPSPLVIVQNTRHATRETHPISDTRDIHDVAMSFLELILCLRQGVKLNVAISRCDLYCCCPG